MDKKHDPTVCCLQEINFKYNGRGGLKVKEWKKIHHANINQKKTGVDILISDKVEFRTRKVTRDREGHYILINRSIH